MGHLKLFRNISSNYILCTLKRWVRFACIFALLLNKKESTYNTLLRKLLEIKPDLNPKTIMVAFEKAAINSFENNFNAVISGCFFHLSQNIWRKIQSEGLTVQYQADGEFQIKLRMLMGLLFVPEQDVPDCFISLMVEFPEQAITVANNLRKRTLENGSIIKVDESPNFQLKFGACIKGSKNS